MSAIILVHFECDRTLTNKQELKHEIQCLHSFSSLFPLVEKEILKDETLRETIQAYMRKNKCHRNMTMVDFVLITFIPTYRSHCEKYYHTTEKSSIQLIAILNDNKTIIKCIDKYLRDYAIRKILKKGKALSRAINSSSHHEATKELILEINKYEQESGALNA